MARSPDPSAPAPAPPAGSDEEVARRVGQIHLCQRLLHVLTGVMIAAFVLILVVTTISTGPVVQVLGRGLYFLILASAAVSVAAWLLRLHHERRLARFDSLSSGTASASRPR